MNADFKEEQNAPPEEIILVEEPDFTTAVDRSELLARFLTQKDWLRADGTIKQDAFFPPRDLHLSVTRHGDLNETALWAIGQQVVDEIVPKRPSAALFGRVDLFALTVTGLPPLRVVPTPIQNNLNHAHIDGWPADKSEQKSLAQTLAAAAGRRIPPPS